MSLIGGEALRGFAVGNVPRLHCGVKGSGGSYGESAQSGLSLGLSVPAEGTHKAHFLVGGAHILGSPFSIKVL